MNPQNHIIDFDVTVLILRYLKWSGFPCKILTHVPFLYFQVKLFNEWWETWSEADKENLTARLRESDSKFWIAVQQEIDGTRRRLEDDFFLTINTGSNTNFTATAPVTVNGNDVNVVPVSASAAMTNGISNEVEDDGNLDMDPPDAE